MGYENLINTIEGRGPEYTDEENIQENCNLISQRLIESPGKLNQEEIDDLIDYIYKADNLFSDEKSEEAAEMIENILMVATIATNGIEELGLTALPVVEKTYNYYLSSEEQMNANTFIENYGEWFR